MNKLRAVFTKDILRLLIIIVVPVWGAGIYVSERTTSVLEKQIGILERQIEAGQEREMRWASLFKEILGCQQDENDDE